MATLISLITGNFTSASTWAISDSTALLDSEAANTELTTSYVASSAFTPGAIIIDGIAVKIASVAASPSGTISVNLRNTTLASDVTGTEVTLNVSDLPSAGTTQNEGGWILFKFSSSILLLVSNNYAVQAKTSSSSQVNLYRDATANNWSRQLRTTTTQAPVAGDILHVMGEHTGAGTGNNITVTMNETATTDYGPGTDSTVGLTISKRGTLAYGTTASTNYYLKVSGNIIVYNGGVFTIGTVATAIPRDSTAVLELDPVADGGMGLYARNGSTLTIQGLSRTSGKNVVWCLLNTDEAANSTSLGVDTDTGWLDNDEICVASTTRTASEQEAGTLNGNAGTTVLTVDGFAGVGGGLLNAHGGGGTALVIAEIGLLTRNVRVRSATSTIMTYMRVAPTSTVDIDWCDFRYLGENVIGKRGIEVETTTGSFNMQFSCIRDCEDFGYVSSTTSGSFTFSNNVMWNCATVIGPAFYIEGATTSIPTVNLNIFVKVASTGLVRLNDAGCTFTNNRLSGLSASTNALLINETNSTLGTFSGNTIHSNGGIGLAITGVRQGTILSCAVWRNSDSGVSDNGLSTFVLDSCTIFGNSGNNILISSSSLLTVKSCDVYSDASFTTAEGLEVGPGVAYIFNSDFGTDGNHTSADLNCTASSFSQIYAFNSNFASATELSSQTFMSYISFFRSHKHDASGTSFKALYRYGNITQETTTRHTASGYAWKLTSNNASFKLILPGPTIFDTFKAAVNTGAFTITAWVRKSSGYSGSAPRLVLVGGILAGVSVDVTDSLSVGADTWEQLSVGGTASENGVAEYYIDADTNGDIFVDDISVTQS